MVNGVKYWLRQIPGLVPLVRASRRANHDRIVRRFAADATGRAGRFPRGIVYEATMRCNLRCEFCYVGELLNVEGQWRQELPLDAIDASFPRRRRMQVSLTGGEVLVRKDIGPVFDLFRRKGYVCGYLTTNGTLIDDDRARALAGLARSGFLKHVSVSVDGPPDLHDRARGVKGTFERTAAGVRRLQDAAVAAGARLRVSINTTVSEDSLQALEQMADVAEQLRVNAIGVNHLMFATPDEVAESLRLLGVADASVIATYVAARPILSPSDVRAKLERLRTACASRGIRFDARPKVGARIIDRYYTANAPLDGRCLYPFLSARVGFSGKMYFCPFIRIEVGDLSRSSLEDVWNGDTYVRLRRRLLENRLFPICRRCCKVELERAC